MKGSKPQLADISLVPLHLSSQPRSSGRRREATWTSRTQLTSSRTSQKRLCKSLKIAPPLLVAAKAPPTPFLRRCAPWAGRLTCASQLISRRALRASRKRVSSRRVPSSRECFHQLSTRLLILGFLNPPLLRFSNQHNTWVVVVVVVVLFFFFWLVGFYHPRSLLVLPTICCHFDSAVFHMVLASGTVVVLLL